MAVQGLLRLDHCFIRANNDDAEVVEVQVGEETKKIVLAPDLSQTGGSRSEHDMVGYKTGYDTGPSNPLPQDEREEVIFAQKKVIDDANEYFEELKEDAERQKEEREAAWKEAGLLEDKEKTEPPKKKKKKKAAVVESEIDLSGYGYAADDNPDNPDNYEAPVFGSHSVPAPASEFKVPTEPAKPSKPPTEIKDFVEGPLKPPGEEDEVETEDKISVVHSEGNTRMVVHHGGEEQSLVQGPGSMKPLQQAETSTDPLDTTEDRLLVSKNVVDMATAVALEMEEKRRKEEWEKQRQDLKHKEEQKLQQEADDLAREAERSELSLDELTTLRQLEARLGIGFGQATGPVQGPAAVHHREALNAYWEFVRENPQDFNGWVYLVQACETVDLLDEIRTVYNAFLPLFPYCYAYWKRYSDIEKKNENWSRALAILHRGLTAIPLSVDLWVAYLELYYKMYSKHEGFPALFREQCEKAVATAGMDYRSDVLWELFVEKEQLRGDLRYVTDLFRRVIGMPTKLYNKHWDNFIAHVRDHHPRDILQYSDYEGLRKMSCRELGLTYRPDPIIRREDENRKVELPEDKLKAGMKERLIASMVEIHERNEMAVDEIYRYELRLNFMTHSVYFCNSIEILFLCKV